MTNIRVIGRRETSNFKFCNHAGCPCSTPLATVREKEPSPPDLGGDPSALTHSPLTYSHSSAPSPGKHFPNLQYKINQLRSKHQLKCKLSYLTSQGRREGKINPHLSMRTSAVIFYSCAAIYLYNL